MDILKLLQSDMGGQLIEGASKQLGLDKSQTTSAMGAAIPLLLGALKNNAGSADGAAGLLGALTSSKHSGGGMLDNLGSILGGSGIDDNVMNDGGKILGKVFGGQESNAASAISKASGIDLSSAMSILKLAAPFVMSYLGKKVLGGGVSDGKGLGDLLGGLLGGGSGLQQKLAAQIQGFDDNDSTIDDIAGMLTGKSGKGGGGIGGLLGGMLKNI
jgi:hypothetical protein